MDVRNPHLLNRIVINSRQIVAVVVAAWVLLDGLKGVSLGCYCVDQYAYCIGFVYICTYTAFFYVNIS